jgi:hypothetical protein
MMSLLVPLPRAEVVEILAADGSPADFAQIVMTCERPGGLSVRVTREDESPESAVAAMKRRELASLNNAVNQLAQDASAPPTP